MNWVLGFLILLLLALAAWLGWRYARLRRRVDEYARTIHGAAREVSRASILPHDETGLEELSNAVMALVESVEADANEAEAERAKLAAVLDQMSDGVLMVDGEGRVTFLNPAAGRLFEAHHAEGRTVAEVVRQYQLVEAWRRCQESGLAQDESVELPASRQFLRLLAVPLSQGGGCLLLVQDLTRVRRLETVRRDFISNLSHELRTPLASLKALAETLQGGALDDPPAARRFLDRVQTEVDALTQMASELLELARVESGQVPLELQNVDPIRLLHSCAERMHLQAERARLALRVEVSASLPEVQADPPRLEQVLVNLIHNAVKFTPPGGKVILSAQGEGQFVHFSVRDTGVGIPADDLGRIFERFYKTDRARATVGTGLGLSIARHIVEAHGGRIWAESVEGQGSTFFFTIPACIPMTP